MRIENSRIDSSDNEYNGRAPVLVAIALIEAGMKYEDAVELIRRERRGALNQKQLDFLEKYKPTGELRKMKFTSKFILI